jgi:hypothetical protein
VTVDRNRRAGSLLKLDGGDRALTIDGSDNDWADPHNPDASFAPIVAALPARTHGSLRLSARVKPTAVTLGAGKQDLTMLPSFDTQHVVGTAPGSQLENVVGEGDVLFSGPLKLVFDNAQTQVLASGNLRAAAGVRAAGSVASFERDPATGLWHEV